MKYVDFTEHYLCEGDQFSTSRLKECILSHSNQGWEFITIVPKTHNSQSQMDDGKGNRMALVHKETDLYAVFGRRELADVLYNEKV